jgi:hypothetical protein
VNQLYGRVEDREERLGGLGVILAVLVLRRTRTLTPDRVRLVLVGKTLQPHVPA